MQHATPSKVKTRDVYVVDWEYQDEYQDDGGTGGGGFYWWPSEYRDNAVKQYAKEPGLWGDTPVHARLMRFTVPEHLDGQDLTQTLDQALFVEEQPPDELLGEFFSDNWTGPRAAAT